jgi:hypothetical protein
MNLGVSDEEQVNEGSVVIHYWAVTSAGGAFTNMEAAGGGAPFLVEVTESAGGISHIRLPKDGSDINRCQMTVSGNGMDDQYAYNCTFAGYPTTTSFYDIVDISGGAFDQGTQRITVPLCPSDCSSTPGYSTRRWTLRRIVSQ